MPVLSTVEAQLPLHKHNVANGNANKSTVNYDLAEVRKLLQCSVSHKRAP